MTYFYIILLVILSGLFSGLTLGFFSLRKSDLKRKAALGDVVAQRVYKVRKHGNLLLCTLLVGNVSVNAILSIFLGGLTTGIVAGFIATGLIVIFGEIIPQASFARHAMKLSSKMVWLVWIFIGIFFLICYPFARLLDKILGKELQTIYSKEELIRIIEEHEDSTRSAVDEDEESIVRGALSFSEKKVKEVMVPWSKVFSLSAKTKLTKKTLHSIKKARSSRIPIFKENHQNIIGILFVKDLVDGRFFGKTLDAVARLSVIFEEEDETLDDVLNAFRKTKNHLFIVRNKKGKTTGIITMEDVLEEIIGGDIGDEFEDYT